MVRPTSPCMPCPWGIRARGLIKSRGAGVGVERVIGGTLNLMGRVVVSGWLSSFHEVFPFVWTIIASIHDIRGPKVCLEYS